MLLSSFRDAWNGLVFAVRSERNMRIHVLALVVVIVTGVWLCFTRVEWMLCVLCMGLVLGLELLNTALEKTLDLLHPERDPRAMHHPGCGCQRPRTQLCATVCGSQVT